MHVPTSIPRGPRAKRGQGIPFPAQRFRQGPRVSYNVVFPMTALSQMVDVDKIGSQDNENNREVRKPHLKGCEQYLDQETEFVLGGLVLAASANQVAFKAAEDADDKLLQEFDEKYKEACETNNDADRARLVGDLDEINSSVPVCSGTLWIPYGVRLEVTDGQHRVKAILNRLKAAPDRKKRSEADDLMHPSQGVAAMVVIEPRQRKRQQDFVDLGHTAAIQQTIKIKFDSREPVTRLIYALVENVPIFGERFLEEKRPSIRRNSDNLYSLSNLKTAVQAMLLGNTRLGAAEAQRKLTQSLSGEDFDRLCELAVSYFSGLSREVSCFRRILDDPDGIDYVTFRDKFMCLNSIGLGVMGMVGHEVVLGRAEVEQAVTAVAGVNWSRDNTLWDGTLRVGNGVARGGNVIELGGSIVKAVGGLPLTARDVERIRAVEGLASKLPSGSLDAPRATEAQASGDSDGETDEIIRDDEPEVAAAVTSKAKRGA